VAMRRARHQLRVRRRVLQLITSSA
jgi:hypothetical protein